MNNRIYWIVAIFSAALLFTFSCTTDFDGQKKNHCYWEASTPLDEGIDPNIVNLIHSEIAEGKYGLIDRFIIIRNGKIVTDEYYEHDYKLSSSKYDTSNFQYNYDHPAWHPYYNYSDLHSLQSVTKSVTSILVGIAIDEGLIEDVTIPVIPFFSHYEVDLNDKMRNSISLEDLLTMRTGIKWDEWSTYYQSPENNCNMMELSDDWIQYVLSLPMDTIPGTKFIYNSGASVLIGKILSLATGMGVDKWAEEKLFAPLGIKNYYWKKTPLGETDTEGGLYLSAYDIAKIGYLILNKGIWEGKRIISEEWIKVSTLPYYIDNDDNFGYGYQWWLRKFENGSPEIFHMNGFGGQFIHIAPKYEILVLFFGWNIHDSESPEKSTRFVLQDLIIPAIKN